MFCCVSPLRKVEPLVEFCKRRYYAAAGMRRDENVAPHAAADPAARAELQEVAADVPAPTTNLVHDDGDGLAPIFTPVTAPRTFTHDDYLVSQQRLRMTRVQHLRTQKLESPY